MADRGTLKPPDMPTISVLPDELVSRIAAGEVVERPSSVVKELVENAIDAQSSDILVEILGGGKKSIQVTDDGEGMHPAEAAVALERYATSKIRSIEDLSSIATLGFRGEALPSILSCSRLELATKPRGSVAGYVIRGEGGKINERTEAGMPEGTRVNARDLFFNLPARRKFLRSSVVEFSHIFGTMMDLGLAFPGVGIRLIHNEKTVLDLESAETREERLSALFGVGFLKEAVRFESISSSISVHGWLGQSEQYTRPDIFLFVNGRRVRNRSLFHAIYRAYRSASREKHQLVIVFIEVIPALVDVNIHPRKSEVRFADERSAHELIFKNVVEALQGGAPLPRSEWTERLEEISGLTELVQLHNSYILLESRRGLILIDQHAAHERILVEKMDEEDMNLDPQRLLFPVTLELDRSLHTTLLQYREAIRDFGFGVDTFGAQTHLVTSVPSICASLDPKPLLIEILQELKDVGKTHDPRAELLRAVACKAAVKAGQPLSDPEKRRLVQDLFSCRAPDYCPHGRPTMIRLTHEELARRFGRS